MNEDVKKTCIELIEEKIHKVNEDVIYHQEKLNEYFDKSLELKEILKYLKGEK